MRVPTPDLADVEPQTEPFARAIAVDEGSADTALLAQVAQQIAHSDGTFEALPRWRAPRSTADLEDEVTNIVQRPARK